MGRRLNAAAAAAAAATGLAVSRGLARFEVVEESMAPALVPGDYLITRRLTGVPERGDVVVYAHPQRPTFFLIKRVVGVPGEAIDIAGGQLHVNGKPMAEPWANGPTTGDASWTLGPDSVFVIGDSRALSADDSRTLGPIPIDEIHWKAVFRYWPPGRIGRPASI